MNKPLFSLERPFGQWSRMRAGALVVAVCLMIGALALVAQLQPFDTRWHGWGTDLAVALAGVFALASAAWSIAASNLHERAAAIAGVGGAILAAAFVYADIVAGAPARVPSAPGQEYVPANDSRVSVAFPDVNPVSNAPQWPDSVAVRDGARVISLAQGSTVRAGPFVFTAVRWPIARIAASDPRGRPVTTTQPNGAAFLSPYLTFPQLDSDGRPVDFFSVPPLHRDVGVKFFDGLPSRGINVPFLVLQIREANGSSLFDGVAVSDRPVRGAGVRLSFQLGSYPAVIAAGAAPIWSCAVGLALILGGLAGYIISLPRK